MIAAVYDCVVYVQAAISEQGPAGARLSLVEAGQVNLIVSPQFSLKAVRPCRSESYDFDSFT
jgi:hypothetical protein